jgi:tRNA U34 5-carboxymethylaminomethyl modifying GTPase MnmE/TrmE
MVDREEVRTDQEDNQYDHAFKIILVGNVNVGKSSLLSKYNINFILLN